MYLMPEEIMMAKEKKVSMLQKINYIFDKKQKRDLVILGILILIGGLFETLGVSMVVPVVAVIVQPEQIWNFLDKYQVLGDMVRALHLDSDTALIITLLITLIAIFIIKNIFMTYLTYKQSKFIAYNRNEMISRVMREFLNRPYEHYLGADIPTVFRITDSDIPNVFALMLAVLSMTTEVVVSVCLLIVLLYVNWAMTLMIIVVFLLMTLINSKVLKPKLNNIGQDNLKMQSRIAKWRLEAIYGLSSAPTLPLE